MRDSNRESEDDLRARLARIDPVHPAVSFEPMSSLRAATLLERAMTADLHTPPATTTGPERPRRRTGLLAAAAALALAAGTAGVVLSQDDDRTSDDVAAPPTSVTLSLPGGDPSTSSCMPFDAQFLKGMSPAFAGTVVAAGEAVTLDVDRWYAGGGADQVVLRTPDPASSAALDGVAFEKGKRYLVTAAQGTVNGCGYSGLATPDLEKAFDEAFPAG